MPRLGIIGLLPTGVGLFGRSMAELTGRPPGRTRELAVELLRRQIGALRPPRAPG